MLRSSAVGLMYMLRPGLLRSGDDSKYFQCFDAYRFHQVIVEAGFDGFLPIALLAVTSRAARITCSMPGSLRSC